MYFAVETPKIDLTAMQSLCEELYETSGILHILKSAYRIVETMLYRTEIQMCKYTQSDERIDTTLKCIIEFAIDIHMERKNGINFDEYTFQDMQVNVKELVHLLSQTPYNHNNITEFEDMTLSDVKNVTSRMVSVLHIMIRAVKAYLMERQRAREIDRRICNELYDWFDTTGKEQDDFDKILEKFTLKWNRKSANGRDANGHRVDSGESLHAHDQAPYIDILKLCDDHQAHLRMTSKASNNPNKRRWPGYPKYSEEIQNQFTVPKVQADRGNNNKFVKSVRIESYDNDEKKITIDWAEAQRDTNEFESGKKISEMSFDAFEQGAEFKTYFKESLNAEHNLRLYELSKQRYEEHEEKEKKEPSHNQGNNRAESSHKFTNNHKGNQTETPEKVEYEREAEAK